MSVCFQNTPSTQASVAPLRASLLLCALLHSLADLLPSLLSKAYHQGTQVPHLCCLLMCHYASRMTTGTDFFIPLPGFHGDDLQSLGISYNLVVPGQLRLWPQSSPASSASQQKHQYSAPGCSFATKGALL